MEKLVIKQREGKILVINPNTGAWYVGKDNTEHQKEIVNIDAIENIELYRKIEKEGLINNDSIAIDQPFSDELTLLILDTSKACNLACKYCFVDAPSSGMNMTKEIALKALNLALEYPLCSDTLTVEFSGGEPLLNFELIRNFVPEALAIAQNMKKNLTFTIQTNGTLINQDIIDFFKRYDFKVGISIDGTKEFHDKNRVFADGTGSCDTIIKNIRLLSSNDCTPSILAVISSPEQYESVINFAMENNIEEIRTNIVTKAGRAEGNNSFSVDYVSLADKFILIAKEILSERLKIHDATLTFFLWNLILSQPHMCFRSPCGSGKNQISVTADGLIFPCQGWRNIHDKPIANVLGIDKLEKELKNNARVYELNNHDVKKIKICKECTYKMFCGVCPREIYTEKHSMNETIDFCVFQNKVFEELMWMFDEYSNSIKAYLLGNNV